MRHVFDHELLEIAFNIDNFLRPIDASGLQKTNDDGPPIVHQIFVCQDGTRCAACCCLRVKRVPQPNKSSVVRSHPISREERTNDRRGVAIRQNEVAVDRQLGQNLVIQHHEATDTWVLDNQQRVGAILLGDNF